MNSSGSLNGLWRGIRGRSRELTLVLVLLLINYLIFSRLGIMVLSGQQPTPTATRTAKPTFTPSDPVAVAPTSTPEPTPTVEATTVPAASPTPITHVVQVGETLSEIARTYDSTVEAIIQENNLVDGDTLEEGQVLLIPSSVPPVPTGEATTEAAPAPTLSVGQRIHVIQAGETLSEIARTYDVTVDEIVQANGLDNANAIAVGQALVIP